MANWKTEKILKDLAQVVPAFKAIKTLGQSNDYDTDNIVIEFHGTKDCLYLCGFTPKVPCNNPDNTEVDYVEVTDDLDPQGGLNSQNEQIGQAFVLVKKYFRNEKFIVVNQMDDFLS